MTSTSSSPQRTDTRLPIVELSDVSVHFAMRSGILRRRRAEVIRAVDGVSLTVERGTTLGLVGESGSGKSTIARLVMGMTEPTSGDVIVDGTNLRTAKGNALRQHRRTVQIVFQDPYSSLDPRMRVSSIIGESLALASERPRNAAEARTRVHELLDLVRLPTASSRRYAHQFSGGERQRVAVARALAPNPQLIVLDEPTSALDVSVRAQILGLLTDLQAQLELSYVFISHDLLTVAHLASVVAVMYLGRIVEIGPTSDVFHSPSHPYTRLLMASIPSLDVVDATAVTASPDDDDQSAIEGDLGGCNFRHRCQLFRELGAPALCCEIDPSLADIAPQHQSACHFSRSVPVTLTT